MFDEYEDEEIRWKPKFHFDPDVDDGDSPCTHCPSYGGPQCDDCDENQ